MSNENETNITREEWLQRAIAHLTEVFDKHTGYALPEMQVSVGWPSAGGLANRKKVIGQCWSGEAQEVPHVFISPLLADPKEVLAVLVHEIVHALCEAGTGHRGQFITVAKAVGLVKPWTATQAGEELAQELARIVAELPEYPHKALKASGKEKKQSTRMLKVVCEDCDYTVRTTAKWLEVGTPTCPCGTLMVLSV